MPPSTQAAIETPVPTDEPTLGSSPQLPWSSIPKFVPGSTNVQEYVQKLKFLSAMWPEEYLSLLAPRAALLVEGTAFRTVARLSPEKLRVNNQWKALFWDLITFLLDLDTFTGPYYNSFGDGYPSFGPAHPPAGPHPSLLLDNHTLFG